MIGIYKITNKINNKSYIGQSTHIEKRLRDHKSEYEWNRHPNYPLYKAFKKYGLENFIFQIIEQCYPQDLDENEIFWIKYYHSLTSEHGYNIKQGGWGDPGERHPNHKLTQADVRDIRTRYANHERCKEVEKIYANKIGPSGFSKVWKGQTWKHIMPEVYTVDNKYFHAHNTGQKGSQNGRSKVTEQDVIQIRTRRKNGQTKEEVFKDFQYLGITFESFKNIWYNCNWKHIVVE